MIEGQLINLLPNTMIDDFFIFGFVAGLAGYAYYSFTNRNDPRNHLGFKIGIYGTFLSGCVGGLLAIVFDRDIRLSILVGLLNQLIYMALAKAAKGKDFWGIIKDVLVRYLTAGQGK